jgi:multidrug transporter EmrE-like cation transporter
MSLSVQIGLLLAIATAFFGVVGFLYKHRGAAGSAPVEWAHPVRTSLALFRNRWYVLGILIAIGSWGFHVAALALAPISLVQAVIAGGLVLLTVVADRLFAHTVTRREWVGVGLAALGLAFLAATLEGTGDSAHSDYDAATLAIFLATVTALAVGVAVIGNRSRHIGVALGASAGLFWAVSDTAIKAQTGTFGENVLDVFFHPLVLVILVASFIGLTVSAKSLQTGKAVPVIAMTTVAANALTIVSGPIVFGDPVPDDSLGLIARVLAFVLVIGAAALTPAPVRAAESGA